MRSLLFILMSANLSNAQVASSVSSVYSKLTDNSDKVCSYEMLTKDCRSFDSLPEYIQFPDGTGFENPRKKEAANSSLLKGNLNQSYGGPTGFAGNFNYGVGAGVYSKESFAETIANQTNIAASLNKEKNLSPYFMTSLITGSGMLGYYFEVDENNQFKPNPNFSLGFSNPGMPGAENKSNLVQASPKVMTPWPPGNRNATFEEVDLKTYAEALNRLSPATRAALAAPVSKYKETQKTQAEQGKNLEIEREKAKQAVQKRKQHVADLVKFAKAAIVKKLAGNVPEDKQSENIKRMIRKVESVEFVDVDKSDMQHMSSCGSSGQNAFYLPNKHQFSVCDGYMNLPDSSLIFVIGHELGHAIDPCSASSGLTALDSELFESYVNSPPPEMNKSDLNFLKLIGNAKVTGMKIDHVFSPTFVKVANSNGFFKVVDQGVPIKEDPTKELTSCITKVAGIRDITSEDKAEMMKKFSEFLKDVPKSSREKKLKEIKETYDLNPACFGTLGSRTQTGEGVSDIFGASVMEEYLKKNPPKNDLDRLAGLSFHLSQLCEPEEKNTLQEQSLSPEQFISQMNVVYSLPLREKMKKHPNDKVRVNELLFGNPVVAGAMGCKPNEVAKCYKELDEMPRVSISKPEVVKKESKPENSKRDSKSEKKVQK